jgi:outer membrane PBP1 activator LpoA protein
MRVDGGTGRLYVEPDGLVRRSLTWARFALGRPQLLGAAPP